MSLTATHHSDFWMRLDNMWLKKKISLQLQCRRWLEVENDDCAIQNTFHWCFFKFTSLLLLFTLDTESEDQA